MPPLRLFLRPVIASRHPEIPLPNGESVDVGRDRTTRLRDTRLSRRQLTLTAHYSKRQVRIAVSGGNPSAVNGERAPKGQTRIATVGDQLELLEGKHCYVVRMEGSDEQLEEERKMNKVSAMTASAKPATPGTPSTPAASAGYNHWSQGLLVAMNDPKQILEQDEFLVVIRDRFPKARRHYLVLPKERIHELANLESHHVPLLKRLYAKGKELAKAEPKFEFRLGYHAVPSMSQVHLHVISQDFDSDGLKHKKHWNSFNTEYFVPAKQVLKQLEEEGEVKGPGSKEAKDMLARDLRCHKCDYKPKHLPDLKKHVVQTHFK